MRPGHGVDAVDLDKADPLDQVVQSLPRGWSNRSLGQGMSLKKQTAGAGVGDQLGHPQPVTLQSVSGYIGFVTSWLGPAGCKTRLNTYYPLVS